jgi:hypothetical protein
MGGAGQESYILCKENLLLGIASMPTCFNKINETQLTSKEILGFSDIYGLRINLTDPHVIIIENQMSKRKIFRTKTKVFLIYIK